MNKNILKILFICTIILSCSQKTNIIEQHSNNSVKTGLDVLFEKHVNLLSGKNIAIVTNHSGLNKDGKSNAELFLAYNNLNLVKIFSPEHGFTGQFVDGELVGDDSSSKRLPPIISLYGKDRKPSPEQLDGIDVIIYDIQDIGARFYTYISTLGLVMEEAAEADIPVVVLDRPNPIGNKIEGPILSDAYKSFVGRYPIAIRYGLTIGELAQMIIGEKMIESVPKLTVIKMDNYTPNFIYAETKLPWVKPSPNIIDLEAALTYPGLCLIEATNLSEGRGTYSPFKNIGAPWVNSKELIASLNTAQLTGVEFVETAFTPAVIPSMATAPKYRDELCYGIEINVTDPIAFNSVETGINILYHIKKLYPDNFKIKSDSMARLWGSDTLNQLLMDGKSPTEIMESYQPDLIQYIELSKKYKLYE